MEQQASVCSQMDGMAQGMLLARTEGRFFATFLWHLPLSVLALLPKMGGLALVARFRASSHREAYLRFNAGILGSWWLYHTTGKRFEVGAPKVAWLPLLGSTRGGADVLAHAVCCVMIAIVWCRLAPLRRTYGLLCISLAYLAAADTLFVAEWIITPVVMMLLWGCVSASRGSLAGMQVVMIVLMSGTGFSKIGPHFDMHGVFPLAGLVGRSLGSPWSDLFWAGLPDDLRPSLLGQLVGTTIISFEVCVPLLLLSNSRAVVRAAVAALMLMHLGIYCCIGMAGPLAELQLWCWASWAYLFLGGDQQGGPVHGFDYVGAKAMWRPCKVGVCLFVVLNLCSHLQPQLDWHPFLRYNNFGSGNQPTQNFLWLRRSAIPKLRERVPFPPAWWESADMEAASLQTVALRWFLEVNHRASAAVADHALERCGGSRADYVLLEEAFFIRNLAGATGTSMNSYDRIFFSQLGKMGFLDRCDAVLVWLDPVTWPSLPFMARAAKWALWDGRGELWESGELTPQELRSVTLPSAARPFVARSSSPPPTPGEETSGGQSLRRGAEGKAEL